MRIEKLKPYEGRVVVLDLITPHELTTRITEVNTEEGYVVCHKPRVFVPVPDQSRPGSIQIMAVEYGHPMYQADDNLEVDANHIFTLFEPSEDHIEAYTRHTSGLVSAAPGALDQLQGLDLSKMRG